MVGLDDRRSEGSDSGSDASDTSQDELITVPGFEGTGMDGAAGQSAMSIPSASTNFDVSGAGVKPAVPLTYKDIRRFLLPGDIANILGGNVWGHCGLIIKADEVYRFPVLYGRVPIPPNQKDRKEEPPNQIREIDYNVDVFILEILQSASNMPAIILSQIGVIVHPDNNDICMVKRIRGGVLLRESHDGRPLICQLLLSPFNSETLDRSLLNAAVSEVMTAPETRWSKSTAVRAFFRRASLKASRYYSRARRRKLADHLEQTWLQRPVCSTVPPRVWQKYLQKRSLRPRLQLPAKNEDGSKVARGEGAGHHLLYCGRSGTVEQEAEDSGAPACVWCCGASGARSACGPLEGRQCQACLRGQWVFASDDPEPPVAFAEDVLRIVPVKDDRVLPEELVTSLLDTGLWVQLDIKAGIPHHRREVLRPARRGERVHATI